MHRSHEDIVRLIKDHLDDKSDATVYAALEEWIRESEENRIDVPEFIGYIEEVHSYSNLYAIDEKRAWDHISASLNKSRKINLSVLFKIAGSILLLLSLTLATYRITTKERRDQPIPSNYADLANPGKTRAVLELANGNSYELTENANEIFEDEGGLIITKDSLNQLSYFSNNDEMQEEVYNILRVPRGGEYVLTLNDGTKVWLNAGSELRYPVLFLGEKRDVFLKGEGYFEVVNRGDNPFHVHLESSVVSVLGTKFNISAYESQDFVATTLVEGSVEVSVDGADSNILDPGQQSTLIRSSNEIIVKEVDTDLYTSWVNGLFEFENMSLERITNQLSRWYKVDFLFRETAARSLHFTGAAQREMPIAFLLEMIEKTTAIQFGIEADGISVSMAED
jgi:transmembrane sensor